MHRISEADLLICPTSQTEADSFFSEAEALELLSRGCNAIFTSCSSLSAEEAAALKDCKPHHSLLQAAQDLGVVDCALALHSPVMLERLRKTWQPWHPFRKPPVKELVEYFGPYAIHYFVFMREFAKWLVTPAILGALVSLLVYSLRDVKDGDETWSWTRSSVTSLWVFALIVWATVFVEHWKRTLARTQHTVGPVRPHLEETLIKPMPLDGSADELPDASALLRHGFSIASMCLVFVVTGAVIHVLLYIGEVVEGKTDNIILQNLPLLLYMAVVSAFQTGYNELAKWLTKHERHSLSSFYLRSLTMKSAVFQLMNNHGWFLYLAFWKRDMAYLRSQLLMFFTVKQVIGHFVEVVLPMMRSYIGRRRGPGSGASVQESRDLRELLAAVPSSTIAKEYHKTLREACEQHYDLPTPKLDDEYCEMAVMFAAATLYAPVFPLGAMFAFLHAVFEGAGDAYKLCGVTRRLLPKQADEDVLHVWLGVFEAITTLAVMSSLSLIWLDNPGFWTFSELLVAEHVFIFFKVRLVASLGSYRCTSAERVSGPDGEFQRSAPATMSCGQLRWRF